LDSRRGASRGSPWTMEKGRTYLKLGKDWNGKLNQGKMLDLKIL
jgi:hypothetical protein